MKIGASFSEGVLLRTMTPTSLIHHMIGMTQRCETKQHDFVYSSHVTTHGPLKILDYHNDGTKFLPLEPRKKLKQRIARILIHQIDPPPRKSGIIYLLQAFTGPYVQIEGGVNLCRVSYQHQPNECTAKQRNSSKQQSSVVVFEYWLLKRFWVEECPSHQLLCPSAKQIGGPA